MGDKIENIDDKTNEELITFVKDLFYRNIEIGIQIEQLNSDMKYNNEVIDEIKDEIDERIFNGTMGLSVNLGTAATNNKDSDI